MNNLQRLVLLIAVASGGLVACTGGGSGGGGFNPTPLPVSPTPMITPKSFNGFDLTVLGSGSLAVDYILTGSYAQQVPAADVGKGVTCVQSNGQNYLQGASLHLAVGGELNDPDASSTGYIVELTASSGGNIPANVQVKCQMKLNDGTVITPFSASYETWTTAVPSGWTETNDTPSTATAAL